VVICHRLKVLFCARFKQILLDLVLFKYPVPNLVQGTNKKPEPAARVFAFKHL